MEDKSWSIIKDKCEQYEGERFDKRVRGKKKLDRRTEGKFELSGTNNEKDPAEFNFEAREGVVEIENRKVVKVSIKIWKGSVNIENKKRDGEEEKHGDQWWHLLFSLMIFQFPLNLFSIKFFFS